MTLFSSLVESLQGFTSFLFEFLFFLTSRFIPSRFLPDKLSNLKSSHHWLPKERGNIIVTGATAGLGYETARYLARFGHRIILTGRDEARGRALVQRIREETGNNRVELYLVDFASFKSVREFAAKINGLNIPIHLLVNNAGITKKERTITQDGLEMMFQVNHASVQLLTTLLLDRIKEAQPSGRIVTLSSGAHWFASLKLEDLQASKGKFQPLLQYGRSKVANILFGKELQRRLIKEGRKDILSVLAHPNFVATDIGREAGKTLRNFLSSAALPAEIGARCQIWASLAPGKDLTPGGYYLGCRLFPVRTQAEDEKIAERLWEITEKLYASSSL